jgi:heme-degrading monooxygenase HmoA
VARMNELFDADADKLAAEHGGISNTVVRTDEGVMVVNRWESEEGMEAFAAVMFPRAEAGQIGEQTGWRMFEVLIDRTPSG